ncbi:MAG: hypothetical protein V8K32_07070 [Candidatus Electrothrix gigas]
MMPRFAEGASCIWEKNLSDPENCTLYDTTGTDEKMKQKNIAIEERYD